MAFTRSMANASWKYIGLLGPERAVIVEGCDALPSMGTKSGLPGVVTRTRNSMMRRLASPSVHEGSGSA